MYMKKNKIDLNSELKQSLLFELTSAIRIVGDSAITIEGCTGIIAYTDSKLVIKMKEFNLSIKGDNILITKMSRKEFNIIGKISGLEFFPNDC